MKGKKMEKKDNYSIHPIGKVAVNEVEGVYRLEITEKFRPALKGLGECTHALVLWWANGFERDKPRDSEMVVELPYCPGVETGVFANRSQWRPNPVGITTSYILGVDEEEGTVDLAWIDAFDGTPLIDIKPYLPMSDRVMDADYPKWLKDYPASMEEAAAFFSDPENVKAFS